MEKKIKNMLEDIHQRRSSTNSTPGVFSYTQLGQIRKPGSAAGSDSQLKLFYSFW